MNRQTILLVEDNPDDAALTLRALQKNNIANPVVRVGDGQEALDYLFAQGAFAGREVQDTPVLILLDLNLPKIGGLEVLQRVRADPRTALVPVVVLTSSKQDDDILASYRGGANSYLRKSVDFTEFIEVVRQFGLYWLLLNVAPPPPTGR
jgi:two-component system, response regulator